MLWRGKKYIRQHLRCEPLGPSASLGWDPFLSQCILQLASCSAVLCCRFPARFAARRRKHLCVRPLPFMALDKAFSGLFLERSDEDSGYILPDSWQLKLPIYGEGVFDGASSRRPSYILRNPSTSDASLPLSPRDFPLVYTSSGTAKRPFARLGSKMGGQRQLAMHFYSRLPTSSALCDHSSNWVRAVWPLFVLEAGNRSPALPHPWICAT